MAEHTKMKLRDDMLAQGVNIVTARKDDDIRGMTVAWATHVGIDQVLMLIGNNKATLEYILSSGAFGLNVLEEGQEEIGRLFGLNSSLKLNKFENISYHTGETASPLLDDCALTLDCVVEKVIEHDDSKLIIGKILAAEELKRTYRKLVFRSEDY